MATEQMTFERFQATGKVCEDLGAELCDSSFDEYGKARGRLYLDCLWIQERPTNGWLNGAEGRWFLLIGREDWLSDDLESLERKLYEFAIDEDYIAAGDSAHCQHRDSGRGVCVDCGEFLPSADGEYWA